MHANNTQSTGLNMYEKFDTLQYTKKAMAAGIEQKQAEFRAEELALLCNDSSVTKDFIKNEIRNVHDKINQTRLELKGDIQNLRTELKGDIQNLRTELKGDIQNLRTELKEEIQNVRLELKEDIQNVKLEIRDVRSELKAVQTELKGNKEYFHVEVQTIRAEMKTHQVEITNMIHKSIWKLLAAIAILDTAFKIVGHYI